MKDSSLHVYAYSLLGTILLFTNLAAVQVFDAEGNLLGDFPLQAGGDLSGANLAGAVIKGNIQTPLNLTGANFKDADLTGAQFTFVTLDDCDFSNAKLEETLFSAASVNSALFDGINGQGSTWGVTGNGADFRNANLKEASLRGDLTDADFTGADMNDAALLDLEFAGARFQETVLYRVTGARLTGTPASLPPGWQVISGQLVGPGAILNGADLSNQDLTGVSLSDGLLFRVQLSGSDLTGVDLSAAYLVEANMTESVCVDTDFTGSDLTDASFQSADLERAVFSGAILRDADLSGARMATASLSGVRGHRASGTPDGLPEEWMISTIGLIGPGCDLSNERISDWQAEENATLHGANLAGATLTNCDLRSLDLSGANLSESYILARFEGANLANTDVSDAVLYFRETFAGLQSGGITGTPSILEGLDLIGGWLIGPGVSLANANLSGLDLSNSDLTGVRTGGISGAPASLPSGWLFRGGLLLGKGINVDDLDLESYDLTGLKTGEVTGTPESLPTGWQLHRGWLFGPGADLSDSDFRDWTLAEFDLRGADLTDAVFNGANLRGTDFSGAKLASTSMLRVFGIGANFSGAEIVQSGFGQSRLKGADFSGAEIRASFFRTDLTSGADLRNADFRNASLDGTSLNGCELAGANFEGATWNQSGTSYWSGATYTLETVLPSSLDPAAEAMELEDSVGTLASTVAALRDDLATSQDLAATRALQIEQTKEAHAELGRAHLPDRTIPFIETSELTLGTRVSEEPIHESYFLFHATAVGESGYAVDSIDPNGNFPIITLDDNGAESSITLAAPFISPAGRRLAALGDLLLVGSPDTNAGGISRAGRVSLFIRDVPTGEWSATGTLQAADPKAAAMFGFALSAYEERVAISAPGGGAVEVFRLVDGSLNREATIEPPALLAAAANTWGNDLLLVGDRLWIGAEFDSSILGTHGLVACFVYADDEWVFTEVLKTPSPSMAAAESRFGSRMAYGGGILAIAEPGANAGKEEAGLVHLYRTTDNGFVCFGSATHGVAELSGFGAQLAVTSAGHVFASTADGGLFRILHHGSLIRVARIDLGETSTRLEDPEYPFPSVLTALGNGDLLAVDTADVELDENGDTESVTAGMLYRILATDMDSDSDGLSDADELLWGTDPFVADSSGDGITDGDALGLGLDPAVNQIELKSFFSTRSQLLDGVFTREQFNDLRPGSTMLEVADGKATLRMRLQQSENLSDWTDAVEASVEVPAEGPVQFFRFKLADD